MALDSLTTGTTDNIAHLMGNGRFLFLKHDVTNYIYVDGRIDYVLHFASPASPIDFLEKPIQTLKVGSLGTHKTLGLAKEKGATFLLASTSEVYGDPKINPQTEEYWGNVNPTGQRSCYDEAKRFAEAITMAYHGVHGLDTRIVRIFNTYGPRQALSNPYTGIAAIFSARILNGNPPLIFEDGLQSRDFTHVKDIVQANLLALENPDADYQVFNVGTGRPLTILDVARILLEQLGRPDLEPQIVQRFRAGDIRHCYADISKIQSIGYTPQVSVEAGFSDLIQWVTKQPKMLDQTALAMEQLDHRGLIK